MNQLILKQMIINENTFFFENNYFVMESIEMKVNLDQLFFEFHHYKKKKQSILKEKKIE
jgi:hypothetical protein